MGKAMRQQSAESISSGEPANENAEDAGAHARLNRIILANAVRADQGLTVRLRKLSYFETARATAALLGLIFAAYLYGIVTKTEA